ncbi:MAG TPA: DoxX family protein [Mycobacteriales bacterium]|jgi:putative oxidoreductase|nr:DoxX family protein [Mycobacteriales bacterium]
MATDTDRVTSVAAGESYPSAEQSTVDAGLFVLRATVGLFIAAHGAQKLFGWFSGPGIGGTAKFFESVGYDPGKFFAVIGGLIEFGGGLALVAGFCTPLVGAAILGDMLNATSVKWSGGFFGGTGFEYELLLAIAAGALALTGPGRFAVDRGIPVLRRHRLAYGAGAVAVALVIAAITIATKK